MPSDGSQFRMSISLARIYRLRRVDKSTTSWTWGSEAESFFLNRPAPNLPSFVVFAGEEYKIERLRLCSWAISSYSLCVWTTCPPPTASQSTERRRRRFIGKM